MNKQYESNYPRAYRYRRIVKAKRFIDDHYDQDIDLDDISDEANFSKYHFLRLFKQAYGKTPWQYLLEVRIDHAAELLKKGQYSVTKICFIVGFESVASFSTLFKKMRGISPNTFRNNKRQKKHLLTKEPLKVVPYCFASNWLEYQKSNF